MLVDEHPRENKQSLLSVAFFVCIICQQHYSNAVVFYLFEDILNKILKERDL